MYLQFKSKAPLEKKCSEWSNVLFLPCLFMKVIDTWNVYPLGATQEQLSVHGLMILNVRGGVKKKIK